MTAACEFRCDKGHTCDLPAEWRVTFACTCGGKPEPAGSVRLCGLHHDDLLERSWPDHPVMEACPL